MEAAGNDYGSSKYWDNRYSKNKYSPYEWYFGFNTLVLILKHKLNKDYLQAKDINILIIGCGDSEISAKLYEDGFINLYSIDVSCVVIENYERTV